MQTFQLPVVVEVVVVEIFEEIWLRNGEAKPFISLGLALGIALATIRDAEGRVKRGPTRLLQIMVSESIHLIWVLRCQWRIEFEGDPSKIHSRDHVRNRWLASVNKRLRWDRTLTNEKTYGRKALKPKVVEATWCTVIDERADGHLPPDWVSDKGVLVGVGRTRRPPGRNR
ncbi:hypothetical protein CC1G_14970 [Coprinopsis cinerea okayama7|uniref:Uncharacterized protein n=1 Tax=Coprinopsis cinerea (strain Okayama-7 / 130 / ATCC MYA-4618 / FGSC 9003) TaxID=240176 RepID=D6RPA2_COPC7|nr:hypothetical protein CC1G_14970 [Coprinopsis cinerea okayama7\|eukprot:XP_002910639.1 hypothetical protein CC1G_14970 [Coprinopsis cinerea okayama7\